MEVNMRRPLPRLGSEEYFVYEISPKKCFTQIYRDLNGDAMLGPIRMGTKMEDGNQQKHVLASFNARA